MTRYEQIAIDGPAASGKSTAAKRLAKELGGTYVNTGNLYRTVAWACSQRGLTAQDTEAIEAMLDELTLTHKLAGGMLEIWLNGAAVPLAEIRRPGIAALASPVSAIPAVRDWLLDRQRESASLGLVVMEGRDIGTVIFPEARHKFFLTASAEERARRRLGQDGEAPDGATLAQVAATIAERDERDSSRAIAPLKPAPDSITIDTSEMSIDQVVALMVDTINARWAAD